MRLSLTLKGSNSFYLDQRTLALCSGGDQMLYLDMVLDKPEVSE